MQAFEIMGIAAVGNNLITYVINEMHFPLSKSANIVTNFIGTIFLLALLGGYLSDSYLGCFWTMLIFGFVELSVCIILLYSLSLSLKSLLICTFCLFNFSLNPSPKSVLNFYIISIYKSSFFKKIILF